MALPMEVDWLITHYTDDSNADIIKWCNELGHVKYKITFI